MKTVYLLFLAIIGIVPTSFSQISSTAFGGDWSNTATWVGGVIPSSTDDVIISDGATVLIDQDASVANLTVGQGASGILEFEAVTARTLTVSADVTINTAAIFRSNVSGTITNHVLSANGNITNSGTLDFSTNGNTSGAGIVFTGAANSTFGGNGIITDIFAITVDKGVSASSVIELNPTVFTFKGSSSTSGNIQSFLNIINGSFKISGTFTMDNGVFTGTGAYTIPATGGFWLNNPNFTVNPRAGTANVDGTLRIDDGIMNIGSAANNRLGYISGTIIIINGGQLNIASRMSATTTFGINYTQTGGTVTVNTLGNTSGTRASFDIQDNGDNSSFTMSGGNIVLQNPNTSGSGNRDYFNDATNINITGGTLQIGDVGTIPSQTFFLSGFAPGITINNSTGGHIVHLLNDLTVYGNTIINAGNIVNLNDAVGTGRVFSQLGTTLTNLGTIDGTVAGSSLRFLGTTAQSYGGDGVLTAPLQSLVMNNTLGLSITNAIASDITVLGLTMIAGDINTGVSTLALGTSTASLGTFTYTAGTIVGKFKRWFDAVVSTNNFPVGIAATNRNANILFTTAPVSGGTLTAQWVTAAAGSNGLPLTEPGFPPVTTIASDGYWTITAGDGISGGVYTGTFTATNVITVTDFTQLVLVKRADGSSPWTLDGTHVTTTGSNTTPVLQRTGMVGFSDFAIGGSISSLPIAIEYFRGSKLGNANQLDWKVSCNNSPTATMLLERSNDGRKFASINSVTATALRCLQAFNFIDQSPNAGINYYRIKLTDADGKFTYSNIIAILNKEKGFDIVSMMPNPVQTTTMLSVASAVATKMEIVVTDVSGKRFESRSINLAAGSNQIALDFSGLAAGTYQLTGYTTEGKKTVRFIKN